MRTRTARLVVGVALGLWGFPAFVHAQPRYQIVDLGPAIPNFCGRLMNLSGQAFVVAEDRGIARTFLVDSGGRRTELGTPPGIQTVGVAINDAGQIAGYMDADGSFAHAFLWTRDVGLVDLAVGLSCDLNSSGDVVGHFFETGHGFLYSRGRVWDLQNDVHPLGGDTWRLIGGGLSINDAGQILGFGYKQGSDLVQGYIMTPLMTPLLQEGFEGYAPPDLGGPGWVSDLSRQVPAKSEWNQPHTGDKNGACWTTQNLDCGMYQEVVAPATGPYSLTLYANADRAGGYVGVNINGATVALMAVDVRGFRAYGAAYTMPFKASQGDTIRVWMYSPATPGYVVIDDVNLTRIP